MKIIYGTIIALINVFLIGCTNNYKTVYSGKFEWNENGKYYSIKMEIPKKWQDGGDFTRVIISTKGQKNFVIDNSEGWANQDGSNMNQIFEASIIKNKYFILYPLIKNEKILILMGWPYASDPNKIYILTLYNNYPEVIFAENMRIYKYCDINKDSLPEFIFEPWLREKFGPDDIYSTYVPLLVYRFENNNEHWSLIYDEQMSVDYTNKTLYGWAGKDFTDSIVIVSPKDKSKPKLMKLSDAQKIYENR